VHFIGAIREHAIGHKRGLSRRHADCSSDEHRPGTREGSMKLGRIRRERAEVPIDETWNDERPRPFEVTPAMREAWLASETLRTPEPGTQDVVTLKRRKR
jgi:hypothetical protein